MVELDNFFNTELETLRLESVEAVRSAADSLRLKLHQEFQQKLGWRAQNLNRGIKVYHFETASYVRLNPVLSSHAQRISIQGNPNLWILLPDGERLGFQRINKNNSWRKLKERYGRQIYFVNNVVVYRHDSGRKFAIYKLEKRIDTRPRINLEKLAKEAIE